jgi:hypothetical protein
MLHSKQREARLWQHHKWQAGITSHNVVATTTNGSLKQCTAQFQEPLPAKVLNGATCKAASHNDERKASTYLPTYLPTNISLP